MIGVIPEALTQDEVLHSGLTHLEVVGSMHERKARMLDLADAAVAMPGGLGTLDELFEDIKRTDSERQMQSSRYKYLSDFLVSCQQAWTGYGGVLLPYLYVKGVQKFERFKDVGNT